MGSETNFSTKHTSSQEDAWVSDPDADASRPGSDLSASPERPGAALGLAVGAAAGSRVVGRASEGRLRTPEEFRRVLRGGRSRGARGIVVHVRERDGGGQPRLGLVVPKGVGTAVVRNRFKRRIRGIWRTIRPERPLDCVVVVREEATSLSFQELSRQVEVCLLRAQELRPGQGRRAATNAGRRRSATHPAGLAR